MNDECGFGFIIQHLSFSIHSALILHPSSFLHTMTDQSKQKTFFAKLKRGLFMTHPEIIEKVKESMTADLPIDKKAIDGLEEGLLGADVGAELTMSLIDRIESRVRNERITSMDRLTEVLRDETRALIPQRQASTIDIA